MDYAATQILEEEEDFECTQRISQAFVEKELTQVGILSIDSTEYQIKNGTTKIGRLSTCDICINDMTVSKIHAEIEANTGQGSTWISDLLSANKTKLNNSILRPKRLYELKDGSVIEFGKVRAVYRTYRPTNDLVIPETPAPTRQKVAGTIIPNTPDSSINNSSADDGSVILGTQTEQEKKSVFRRPLLPQQRQSTSIDKNNTSRGVSTSENDDSQSDIRLRVNDSSESEGVSIFDMETQKYEESRKTVASGSIHDMETQNILTKMPKNTEANATVKKQSTLNPRDKMVGSSAGISDTETQNCINGNEQQFGTAVGTGNTDVPNETAKKSTTNIHDLETQNCVVGAGESNIDIRGVAAGNSTTNIHDLETQNYLVDTTKNIRDTTAKRSTTNIHDLETQNCIIGAAKSDIGARRSENDKSKTRTAEIEHDIHNLETQKTDNNNIVEDICDMETQLALGGTTSESSSSRADKNSQDKSKDQRNAAQGEANRENAATLPSSRSDSPGMILNLSSQDIDVEHPSSPLNESAHLLESSDLLEYFAEGIDKPRECNTSTPKPPSKTSLPKDKAENAMENDQKGDIYNLPTQRINGELSDDSETNEEEATVKRKVLKKKREKPRPTQIEDDSETDAEDYLEELAKKQGGSLETTSKSRDTNVGNNNGSETSANSDDMFDMLTQKLDSHSAKDTSNSPIKQQPKINRTRTIVDDMMPTQKMNVKDKRNRHDRPGASSADIDDAALTQPLLSHKAPPKIAISSKNSLLANNPNDVDDTAPTQIVDANSSISETNNRCASPDINCEDLDYETAPTQVIGEVVEKRNTARRTSDRTKAAKFSKVNLNDTLERNLEEMFDDVNSDSVHEHALMSTQCLEDILQSSQCDNSLLPNKSTVKEKAPQTKSRKKSNQLPLDAKNSEVNKNTVSDIDSQNSDSYFTTITTRRKRNVIKDTQDFVVSTENVPQKSKDETKDDNLGTKSNKKGKRVAKSKSKTDATTVDLIDNTASKIIPSESNERIVGKAKSVRQKRRTAPKADEQILKADSREVEVDHAKGNLIMKSNALDTYAPCSSEGGQGAQRLSALLESDDDILTRLPAVRISGTLSNPPSPSASSTSTVLSVRSKRGDGKDQKKDGPSKSKPLTRNSSRAGNKPPLRDINSSSLENPNIDAMLEVNDSGESDSATNYKRFKQMADRMLNKEGNSQKKQNKSNKSARGAGKTMSDEGKSACSSLDVPKDPKQSYNSGGSRNPPRSSSRATRSSSRQNNESSCVQLTEEAHAEGTIDKFTKPKTRSTAANRKRGLNTAEETTEEQISSKKHKVDGVVGEAPRKAEGTSDTKAENAAKSTVTRSRRRMTDKSERTRANEKETSPVLLGLQKTLKVVINPIVNDASQEVEMIMMRNVSGDVQDENLSVRGGSNARTFQKEFSSRSTRSRKQAKTNATIDSSSIESNVSSETSDLESVQSGNSIAPTRAKRARLTKNSVPPPQETRAPNNEVFKRPARINRSSSNLTYSITENSMSDDSRNSIQSNSSLNIRLSRSKTAGNKNMWKVEMNENSRRNRTANISVSPEINTNVGFSNFCVSTPTRTRRSTSSMSISSPSATRQRVLFTGIKEDKYDNIIRTLGGSRVETPNLCTVLVTDKVRRTYKFLCALAKGVPIVSVNWLSDSESARQFLEWESYILKDLVAEAKFGFRLRKSLDKAKEKRLLVGYTVVLTPNIGQPPTKELRDMIISCGGKALLSPPAVWPEKAMIISHQEDLPIVRKYLAKAPKTVTVQSTEFILIGILRQEVDLNKHRLI